MQSMRLVRTAIQDYYALNAPYTDLKAQLVIANESYNNPQNAAGDKATFLAVINKAQALVDGVTAEYSEEVANNMIAAKAESKLFIVNELAGSVYYLLFSIVRLRGFYSIIG